MEFKNTYLVKEYETIIQEVVKKYGDKLEGTKKYFISDINYLFNEDQLEKIKELTPLQRFYVLSKKENKAISQFENSKLNIALGDLTTLIDNTSALDEESLIEVAITNKDKILPIPYIFESTNISQLLIIELQEIVCMDKFEIKKCKNCGKYFVPEKRTDELYCTNIYRAAELVKKLEHLR